MQGNFAPAAAGKSKSECPCASVAGSSRMEKNSPNSAWCNGRMVARACVVMRRYQTEQPYRQIGRTRPDGLRRKDSARDKRLLFELCRRGIV